MSPQPHPEPSTAVLVLAAPLTEGDVPRLCQRLAAVLSVSDARVIVCDVRALPATARTVDGLARLQLTARRLGCGIRLSRASPELSELLAFMGLADVVSSEPMPAAKQDQEADGGQQG